MVVEIGLIYNKKKTKASCTSSIVSQIVSIWRMLLIIILKGREEILLNAIEIKTLISSRRHFGNTIIYGNVENRKSE